MEAEVLNHHLLQLVLNEMVQQPERSPKQISDENNWKQITDGAELEKICRQAIEGNPDLVAQYRSGKEKVFKALVGAAYKVAQQRANMNSVVDKLKDMLRK